MSVANSDNSHNGASLSYLNAQGTGGSATPQILADATVPSGSEFAIMLGVKCDGDDCGYTRPGSVAYRKCLKCVFHHNC